MGTKAVGMYLQRLREHQHLTRAEVAELLETNEMQILRIEKGSVDTRASFLLAFTRTVQGSTDDIEQLLLDSDNDPTTGSKKAEQRIFASIQPTKEPMVMQEDTVAQAMELVLDLRKTPNQLAKWVKYGKKLVVGD
jgi:transcriptional regulator with XRE-family HTH domain